MTKVVVNNLPFFLTDEDFTDLCLMTKQKVSSALIKTLPNSTQSTGVGIAVFETLEAANIAIEFLNDKLVNDREISAEIYNPQPNSGSSIEDYSDQNADKTEQANSSPSSPLLPEDNEVDETNILELPLTSPLNPPNVTKLNRSDLSRTLYVGNLTLHVTSEDLFDVFSDFSVINVIFIPLDPIPQVAAAHVIFSTPNEAKNALDDITGTILDGLILDVRFASQEDGSYLSPSPSPYWDFDPALVYLNPPTTPPLTLSSLEPLDSLSITEASNKSLLDKDIERRGHNVTSCSPEIPSKLDYITVESKLMCSDGFSNSYKYFHRSGPNTSSWNRHTNRSTSWYDLEREVDPKTILVTDLPKTTTEADLLAAFSGYKIVRAKIFIKAVTGFGFVVFEDEDEAKEVLKKRYIKVSGKSVPLKQGYHRVD